MSRACEQEPAYDPPDAPLSEPFFVIRAIAGGKLAGSRGAEMTSAIRYDGNMTRPLTQLQGEKDAVTTSSPVVRSDEGFAL